MSRASRPGDAAAPAAGAAAILRRHAPLAACAAFLIWHSLQFGFVTDDAYISFVYARNLAEHGELVYNVGLDPVEGYTNFLWTVLLAGGMLVGLAPEPTSLVLGTAFAIGTLVVVARLMAHLAGRDSPWDAAPAALLALSAGYACWSSGGLETQMFTFWIALGIHAYVRGDAEPRWLRRMGVLFALAALTRPEGLLVVAVVAAHRLAWRLARDWRRPLGRDELIAAAWFAGIWGVYFAWRWRYYGHPLPNTFYIKAGGDAPPGYRDQLLANGLHYVWQWARQTRVLYALPLIAAGAFAARRGSRRLYFGTLAVPLALVYLAYAVNVGGDFMGLHRFIMPVFVLAAVTTALGLRLIPHRTAALAATAALLAVFAYQQNRLTRESMRWGNWQSDRGIDTPAFLSVYAHDRALIGERMRPCMRPDDFAILGGAGAKPYHGRMRGIDVFGLVSERIAHEVRPTNPRAGHNKWAPNALLLSHDPPPTFIFSCYSIHADPARPHLNCAPGYWLAHGYEQITIHVPGLAQQGEYYTFFAKKDRAFTCP